MNVWLARALAGHVVDIGQLTAIDRRTLDKAARAGLLRKYRGHWSTLHPEYGMGGLKTIWTAAARTVWKDSGP